MKCCRPLMQRAVRESGADIIGFQEVTPVWKEYFDKDLFDFEHYLVYRSEKNLEGTPIYWNPARLRVKLRAFLVVRDADCFISWLGCQMRAYYMLGAFS